MQDGPRHQRSQRGEATLREAWASQAQNWIRWARTPQHDSYWRFHGRQFLSLVPQPGEQTVDLGSGEGRLARELSKRGHNVVAIDASEALTVAAREADPSIPVIQADAARLPIRDATADLVLAFMSLQDVDDMPGAVREAARVLVPGARFCFAIVHPLNSAGSFIDESADSPFVISGPYLESFRYEDRVERDGLEMSFFSDHRSLETYFEALAAAGFVVERLREPPVPDEAALAPWQRRWQRVPLFLHVLAVRR